MMMKKKMKMKKKMMKKKKRLKSPGRVQDIRRGINICELIWATRRLKGST